MKPANKRRPPDVPFLVLWTILIVVGFVAGEYYLTFRWYLVLFAAINVATFVLYGIDKLLAVTQSRRIPERTLQFTAFLVGSPGALLAMKVFRHKTSKTSFQFVLAILVLVQILIIFGIAYYLDPSLFATGLT